MDSIREATIDFLEKILFQMNLLFDLENSTAYLILKPFLRNIAEDPLVFIITFLALFLIPYTMIRVRKNTVAQGRKADKLLKKLETERSTEIPEEELELPEPESAQYDNTSETIIEEEETVQVEAETAKAGKEGDPELEFLKDLDLDSMYTKTYSLEDAPEEGGNDDYQIPGKNLDTEVAEYPSEDGPENEKFDEYQIPSKDLDAAIAKFPAEDDGEQEISSDENQIPAENLEVATSKDTDEDSADSWEFTEEEGPGEPVISQLTEENTASADFEDTFQQFSEAPNIEEPEDSANENLDRVNTIDELTRQMEATIENISNQIIEEDIDDFNIPQIPTEAMDFEDEDKGSSVAPFGSEYSESDSLEDEEPATTTPIIAEQTNEPLLENADDDVPENEADTFAAEESVYPEKTDEREIADTGLNKLLGISFEDEEEDSSETISVNASDEETEKPTDTDRGPLFPQNLERSEILTSVESTEAPEPSESESVGSDSETAEKEESRAETSVPETQKAMENAEKKTKLLVDRLENFQKHLEQRLTTLEMTLEKRKTGHGN